MRYVRGSFKETICLSGGFLAQELIIQWSDSDYGDVGQAVCFCENKHPQVHNSRKASREKNTKEENNNKKITLGTRTVGVRIPLGFRVMVRG